MKKLTIFLLLGISVFIFSCGINGNKQELKLGKYVSGKVEQKDHAWVLLTDDDEFEFSRDIATSYRPKGTYSIKNNILTLFVSKKEEYKFEIKDENIVFISGEFAEGLVEKGTVFSFEK